MPLGAIEPENLLSWRDPQGSLSPIPLCAQGNSRNHIMCLRAWSPLLMLTAGQLWVNLSYLVWSQAQENKFWGNKIASLAINSRFNSLCDPCAGHLEELSSVGSSPCGCNLDKWQLTCKSLVWIMKVLMNSGRWVLHEVLWVLKPIKVENRGTSQWGRHCWGSRTYAAHNGNFQNQMGIFRTKTMCTNIYISKHAIYPSTLLPCLCLA